MSKTQAPDGQASGVAGTLIAGQFHTAPVDAVQVQSDAIDDELSLEPEPADGEAGR